MPTKIRKQLAQVRPANTSAVSALSGKFIVNLIIVTNTSGSAASYRLFHDIDGTTYDETTALFWDEDVNVSFPSIISFREDAPIELLSTTENLAIKSSVGNALTFTFYGYKDLAQ